MGKWGVGEGTRGRRKGAGGGGGGKGGRGRKGRREGKEIFGEGKPPPPTRNPGYAHALQTTPPSAHCASVPWTPRSSTIHLSPPTITDPLVEI
jgi:hypothetical protein